MGIKNRFKEKQNQIKAAVFIITIVIACAPLISKYCINGHDLEYHLLRIESLKEGIKMGRPFLKVNVLFFGGSGYASSMFYPDFLLYIPAVLRVFGVSINASYHIFVAVCIVLTYMSAYLCIKKMTENYYCGMISAVTLTLCQYHLDDIYIRSAVGEYTAFIFIPVVIYALYNVIYEDMDKPQLFVLGYLGILLCHTSTFAMCTVLGITVFFRYFKRVFLNKDVLKKLVISTVLTLLLSCFYWLPMLEQFLSQKFYVSTPWMQPKDEAVDFIRIFGSVFPALGPVCVLILIPRIFIKKETKKDNERYADILMIAGVLFMLLACSILPWDRLGRYLSFIQFPWRFFIMASSLFSMAAGLIYSSFLNEDEGLSPVSLGSKVLILVLIINGLFGFNAMSKGLQGYYDYSDDYYSYKPFTANVIAGEWLPKTVRDKDSLVDDSEHMFYDDGSEVDFTRVKNTIEADIDRGCEYADIPFVYYKGYAAKLTHPDGSTVSLNVTGEGNNGMCRVYLKDQGTGKLKVYYGGTPVIVASIIISLISLLFVIVIYYKHKENLKKKESE